MRWKFEGSQKRETIAVSEKQNTVYVSLTIDTAMGTITIESNLTPDAASKLATRILEASVGARQWRHPVPN